MEKTKGENLKKTALVTFLFVSIGLIVLIWINGALELDTGSPDFYRQATPAQTYDYRDFLSDSEHSDEHQHGGSGGRGNNAENRSSTASPDLTPAATTDWDAIEEDQ